MDLGHVGACRNRRRLPLMLGPPMSGAKMEFIGRQVAVDYGVADIA
jgi:hypothetical protein